jgi:arabinofuranan 3-O-arabinosyltransferase
MTLQRDRPALAQKVFARTVFAKTVRPGQTWTGRWIALVWLVVFLLLIANAPGRIFFDTKLGVDIAPGDFLARLWQLWNPNEWLGTLQDQYVGYAFPMAPFYLLAESLRMPVWLTERLWLSLLVAVGFSGLMKLAAELKIGTERSRAIAGLAFAMWPTFTILIGSTSAGLLPGLLAPWAVVPLVRAARGGPVAPAAARSGVAVLFMGGVNATSTLDALILPALFIVTQLRGRRMITLLACWVGAVALATSWWTVPLLLQAKYSFNFLPYIEQAATTTATMSAATFLRGSGNWTAYLNFGQPWLSAGWAMVSNPMAIMAAAVAAGAGLFGVARRDVPFGAWLRLSLGAAALVALAGYPGHLGGLLHQPVDQLLNGVLSPLRSVYKVEPAAAAVLALGIAHALALRARRPALGADHGRPIPREVIAAPIVGLVLLGLAYPYVSGQVLNPGSFKAVPEYWYQVSAYIRRHSPNAPVLVAPAAAHGVYLWGETIDEPLEPLANSPWVEQGLVPYGGAGSQLLLSSLEAAIASGEPTPGLDATLARSGIRYVVVRNDLSSGSLGYTPPEQIHQALASSGFRRVAAFGPVIAAAQTDPGAALIQSVLPSYRAVEVFEARSAAGLPPPTPVVALPVSRTVLVNGGPDALLQLTGQHLIGSAPVVIAGDKLVTRPAQWVVTDTLPRADHDFGGVDQTPSYTYTRTETNPPDDPLGGAAGPPRQLLPVSAAGHQTVAVLSGAASVTASSSGSWLEETPQIDPVNAFDGNPSTYWAEASPSTPVGQWIEITFRHRLVLPSLIGIRLLVDGSALPVADRLTVTTDAGSVTSSVRRTGAVQPLRIAAGATRSLQITIAGARGQVPGGPGAGFTEIDIPGVTVTRYAEPAQDQVGRQAGTVAFSFHRQLPSPASLADVAAYPPMARVFTTSSQSSFRLSGSAIAVPGAGLDALLAALAPVPKHGIEVTASSTLGSLPALAPSNLFRAGKPGPWIAGAPYASLRLRWQGKRTIKRMVVQSAQGVSAAPESIKITSPAGVRYASVGFDGLTEIVPPLVTDQMTISFPVVQYTTTIQPGSGQAVELPVGLSELSIPALRGLRANKPAPSARFTLPCGRGPAIMIDGHSLATTVSGTFGDLTQLLPVQVRLCGAGSALGLAPGRHWLVAARPGSFTITDLSLVSASTAAPAGQQTGRARSGQARSGQARSGQARSGQARSGQARTVRIMSWGPELRQIRVGPGAATYLELHQNANPGWVATLRGRALTPVRLDGWQQGFVVPAGVGGVITLTFVPYMFYRVWIILSVVGVIVLLGFAFLRRRRGRVHELMDRAVTSLTAADLPPNGAVAPVKADKDAATDSAIPVISRWPVLAEVPSSVWLGLIALCGLILIISGPVVIVVPVLGYVAYRWPDRLGAVAFAAALLSGVLAALSAHPAAAGSGAFSGTAQALAVIALAAAIVPVWRGLPRRRSGEA